MSARFEEGIPMSGRMEGCQSTNHTDCYGDLWQCDRCGKTVCYGEGGTHDFELCDDCWVDAYPLGIMLCSPEDDVPF